LFLNLISAKDIPVSDHANFSSNVSVKGLRNVRNKFEIFLSTIIDVDNVPLGGSGCRICQKRVDEVGVVVASVQRLLLVMAAKDFLFNIIDDLDQVGISRIRIIEKKIVAFQINLQVMFIVTLDANLRQVSKTQVYAIF
jgi:hypothetical protein